MLFGDKIAATRELSIVFLFLSLKLIQGTGSSSNRSDFQDMESQRSGKKDKKR